LDQHDGISALHRPSLSPKRKSCKSSPAIRLRFGFMIRLMSTGRTRSFVCRREPSCVVCRAALGTVRTDSHTDSVRRVQPSEIVEIGRLRCWSEDAKLRIVLEILQRPRLVSATARWHGISRPLLLIRRHAFAASGSSAVAEPGAPSEHGTHPPASPAPGRRMNVLDRGRRVVKAGVYGAALTRVLDVAGAAQRPRSHRPPGCGLASASPTCAAA